VIVAMERERWSNMSRGARHIEVNLADFTAKIIDNGKVTFSTRSVVGARDTKRQSPEFSDQMEFMVLNPSWHVPRSIATGEYLPQLQQDPYAVDHLVITDRSGRQVDRASMDFNNYTPQTFPYAMRQPPSQRNALGLVKFMFPNKYNIYLHDTPAKNLFARETRAYSHGCIRLADPFDFAYALLAKQTSDPEGFFQSKLASGKEVQVNLQHPVPVHIIYRTAFVNGKGQIQYRRDVYGRDARIWQALSEAGVALRDVQG
jgi:murein L,D-transpeptidase YcbB/YkuD